MKTSSIAIVIAAALSGAAQTAYAGDIADADPATVAKCTFLKEVNGRTVFGERLKEPAVAKAKEYARGEAAKLGATHIVWDEPKSTDITTITGKAYRCGG
jgi:hypothetical protein